MLPTRTGLIHCWQIVPCVFVCVCVCVGGGGGGGGRWHDEVLVNTVNTITIISQNCMNTIKSPFLEMVRLQWVHVILRTTLAHNKAVSNQTCTFWENQIPVSY